MKNIRKTNTSLRLGLLILILPLFIQVEAQLKAKFSADVTEGCEPLVVQFRDSSTGNPTQWFWDLGNGITSTQQNPKTFYFNPGVYNVRLIVKNGNGSDTLVRNSFITVYSLPTVDFVASPTSGCYPLSVKFTDLSNPGSGTTTKWDWDFGDGTVSNEQNPQHVYELAGSFTITLRITNSRGCVKATSKPNYVNIQSGVKAGFTYNATPSCNPPTTIQFLDSSRGDNITSYLWDFGDGTTSTVKNPIHTFFNSQSYTIKLIVKNSSGCVDTAVKVNGVVVGSVKADFTRPDTVCFGMPATFTNTSSPAPAGVTWFFGDGTTSNNFVENKIYSTSGNFNVKLVADFGACKDSITKPIHVLPKLAGGFSESGQTSSCSTSTTVSFTSNYPNNLSHFWDFGDGATSTNLNPVHTYTKSGTYTVKLVVRNARGCMDSVIKPNLVSLLPPKINGVKGLPFGGCAPETFGFDPVIQSNEPVVSYQWNFGDGNTSTLATPTHTYTKAGIYTLTLSITTVNGCTATFTDTAAVKISIKPKANFNAAPLDACAFEDIKFSDASTGAITKWSWNFGDGGSSDQQNPSYNYSDTGLFTVRLIVLNNYCPDTLILKDYIHIKPPISYFNTVRNCDTPLSMKFVDASTGALTYAWNFGDGTTANIPNPVHLYSAPGTYRVSLEVTNGTCRSVIVDSVRIIDEKPILQVSDTSLCKNNFITFTTTNVNRTNISSYEYFAGDGTNYSRGSEFVYKYAKAGRYNPFVVTTDIFGCTDTARTSLDVRIKGATANFSNPAGTCLGSTVTFNDLSLLDSSYAIKTWTWDFGDTTIQFTAPPFQHTYKNAGTYNVKLSIIDESNCTDSVVKFQTIIITNPDASFYSDSVKCSQNSVTFNNQSNGLDLTYFWNFGDGGTSTDANPTHAYANEGIYYIKLTVTDRFGCTDTVTHSIKIANAKASYKSVDSVSLCPPFVLNLQNTSQDYASLLWDFGDRSFSNIPNPSHFYNYPGNYTLKLIVNGFGNCSDTAKQNIVVRGPSGSISYDSSARCNPDTVSFSATTRNNSSFIWDFGDGNTITTNDSVVSHIYTLPGVYRPRLLLVDIAGCRVPITGPYDVVVADVVANIINIQKTFCDSGSISFKDSSYGINDRVVAYAWKFGDGATSSQANPSHFYSSPGLYNVSLVTTTTIGCSDTAALALPIKVVQSPLIEITGDTAACISDSVLFAGNFLRTDTSTVKWAWNFGNGKTSNVQNPSKQLYTQPGSQSILATAINSSGCIDTASFKVLIKPLPIVDAGLDSIICLGQSLILKPTGAATYTWTSNPSLSCTNCANPTANPRDTAVRYYVKGTSSIGCVNTDSVAVKVVQPFQVSTTGADTLCNGESTNLVATGTDFYTWTPSVGLSATSIPNPVARPSTTTTYTVVGTDYRGCFRDTATVPVVVYPIPQFNIVEQTITLSVGNSVSLTTTNSPDITRWRWTPQLGLSCSNCPEPIASPRENITYKAEAINDGGCKSTDQVTIVVTCNTGNFYIPNTFSPNGDGQNDYFYPRGKGIAGIRSLTVYNRWGAVVFQKMNFSVNDEKAGWNGMFNGQTLDPDVFIYFLEIICENNQVFPVKGNITLIK